MTTAIIGTGSIGSRVARLLAQGGERVVLANRDPGKAELLAAELGGHARAATTAEAVRAADAVVLAVGFPTALDMVAGELADLLPGKVLVDPTNPIVADGSGGFERVLPDDESAGQAVAARLPAGVALVKAFGTLPAELLESGAHRGPEHAVLFYATDDRQAAGLAERLIKAAGYAPVRAGGIDASARIEVGGDLHPFGGLNGQLLTAEQADEAVTA